MRKRIQIYNNTSVDLSPYLTGMFQYYQKHGVTLNYDISSVSVPVPATTMAYNPLVGSVPIIHAESLVPPTDHDITLFFFSYDNWKAPWYYPWPLWDYGPAGKVPRDSTTLYNGKPFIAIGYWPTDSTVAQRFLHEPMHALAKILGCQDVMDATAVEVDCITQQPV